MANFRELRKLDEEFKEISKKNISLNVESQVLKTANSFNVFSSNRFQKYVRELDNKEKKYFSCEKSGKVIISGSGNLHLNVTNSIDLLLDFSAKNEGTLNINILVREHKNLNLLIYLNTKNMVFVNIFLESSAHCRISEQIRDVPFFVCDSQLLKNSSLEIKSTYLVSNTSSYIHNMVEHKEERTSSDMNIQGLAMKNAQVTNDGFILINSDAQNSSGHQYMKNILVDKSSRISSEPILEIKNSEVKCSHGSSISQISDQLKFYMQSRGLNYEEVLSLIAQGFVESSLSIFENRDIDFEDYRNKMLEFLS